VTHWRRRIVLVAIAVVAVASALVGLEELHEARAFAFEKLAVRGVPNVGRIGLRLYRGGQPSTDGFVELRKMGINTIVSFTLDGEGARAEEREVVSLGLRYEHLPWSASTIPARDDVERFLKLTDGDPSSVVFAHCKAGADRTGVMIAAYRHAVSAWSLTDAIDEMNAFGYEREFHPQLQRYVASLWQAGGS
jgi:protein tyrosine phosphatase (PTP) superfamily phosphohydrolase (DUF442 family)